MARTALILTALSLATLLRVEAQVGEGGLMVGKLKFEGNSAFGSQLLEAAIATTNSSWFATSPLISWMGLGEKRRLNELDLRRDVERLRIYYRYRGYLDVQVDTAVVRTLDAASITFIIHEGQPIIIRHLEIKGLDSLPDREGLLDALPLRQGNPFDRSLVYTTADTIQIRLRDQGYAEALVSLDTFVVDRPNHSASVSLLVTPGVTAVIGEIHVAGTKIVDSAFVRSLLATQPGRGFRERDIQQSQLNLYRSELFRYASVGLDTAHFVPGSGIVPITITVVEGPMHRARLALGYGTNDCFRTGAGWTARNALGSGQVFDVSAQVSKLGVGRPFGAGLENNVLCSALKSDSIGSARANYNVTTSFKRPVFLSPSTSLTLSLFAERRSEFAVYLREDIGGSINVIRETRARTPISLTYRLSYGRTQANAVAFCAYFNACTSTDVSQLRQKRPLATLTLGVQRTRVNNLLDPSRGSTMSAEITSSSTLLGSSRLEQFTRVIGDVAAYQPLGGSVLAAHLRGGMVFAPRLQLGGGTSNFVPPEQRFYAGGPNDVRGFNRNQLGPLVYVVQESDIPASGIVDSIPEDSVRIAATGGNSIFVANLELRVPTPLLGGKLGVALFVDGGSVWERNGPVDAKFAFRVTPGLGVRFLTPLGPVRVDAAYNWSALPRGPLYKVTPAGELIRVPEDYQKKLKTGTGTVFQFSVGHAF